MAFLEQLGIRIPIVQAPMAGVATPALAAAVSDAGGLGSIGVGATDAAGARAMIETTRALTARPFNVNVFVHSEPQSHPIKEAAWLEAMRPLFREFDAEPPQDLHVIYKSFAQDDDMLELLVETAPAIVSFHFGLPDADRINALKAAGCVLLATATSLPEAELIASAGIDAIVAQGYEAGGHRGTFDPAGPDDKLGTTALTQLLVQHQNLPVIAAGGMMDGSGIRAALDLGAVAAQLGTAFIACPESSADAAYRAALKGTGAAHTIMTDAISGRPARCLGNRFTAWAEETALGRPDYPIAYDAGKALNVAAKAKGETGFGAQWAGQGAPMHRVMPAADLLATLHRETVAQIGA
ncbi:NAD(P)H-dependent flavin oxidoreductase [Paracoccus aestuariivivens]|uniref:Nitronate monooxygenase n=1 Tax=Paracoccus aestuariivivens TaxID=1820333 RepID=A0A6L6JFY8_9RHOB|nr:nitronate monooxygenase [Paracoccus aestuariivivens]MTH79024.1 nitronate monooxygenase [Paracoccus aestuariivivens]